MRRWLRRLAPPFVAAAALTMMLTIGAGSAVAKKEGRPVDRVVMFSSDGMRPDLMQRYASQGYMPTYKNLMKDGAVGKNGMVQAFPPNTGVGWYTMATGTYPSEHGSTNNTFFRSGDIFSNRSSFSGAGVLQADTIANAAERAGKKVAQIDWVGGIPANITGPTVDFATFYSNRGVLVGQADSTEQAGAAAFGTNYQVGSIAPASSTWTNVPAGDPAAPPKEAAWTIPTSFAAQNPTRTYNVYFYDSNVNGTPAYDHAIVATNDRDGSSGVDLAVGDFKGTKVTLTGTRAQATPSRVLACRPVIRRSGSKSRATTRQARTSATSSASASPIASGTDGVITWNEINDVRASKGKPARVASCCATRTSLARVEMPMPTQIAQAARSGVNRICASS